MMTEQELQEIGRDLRIRVYQDAMNVHVPALIAEVRRLHRNAEVNNTDIQSLVNNVARLQGQVERLQGELKEAVLNPSREGVEI